MQTIYVIQDTLRHQGYEDEDLYVVSLKGGLRYTQVGHRSDAIKFCTFNNEESAKRYALHLKRFFNREWKIEEVNDEVKP